YNASPNGSVSHYDLFRTAARYYHGRDIRAVFVPKPLTAIGLMARSLVGRVIGRPPFEQPWMMEYVDKQLNIDASVTYATLGWKPTPRYHILRRLLFLTEKMTNHPTNWAFRNEILLKRVAYRKSIAVYDILVELREPLIDDILGHVYHHENDSRFFSYRKMDRDLLRWYITLNYQLIATTVRNRDRSLMQNYAQIIASRRFVEGFKAHEVGELMKLTGDTINKALLSTLESGFVEHIPLDYISLTVQFAVDEIEDSYELLETNPPQLLPKVETLESLANCDDLKRIVRQLEDICSGSL
ncbi:MAG: hypothetical protein SV775_19450, partial [Thermodesulfobacteriota bacterium]|nr:hypothetical protein [Thermodesulfobacteriota bacterium]